jgi:hypothetical protein
LLTSPLQFKSLSERDGIELSIMSTDFVHKHTMLNPSPSESARLGLEPVPFLLREDISFDLMLFNGYPRRGRIFG